MTPEQLDEIEKEARAGGPEDDGAGDIAAFLVDCRILPLVKAVREAQKERDEARAEVERLRDLVLQVHALAEKAVDDYRALKPILNPLREMRKITENKS